MLGVQFVTSGTEAQIWIFTIGPHVFVITVTLVRIIVEDTPPTIEAGVRLTEGVVKSDISFTAGSIKTRTAQAAGIRAVINAITDWIIRNTSSSIFTYEVLTGVIKIFTFVPLTSWGAITLIIMALFNRVAGSRYTWAGVADIKGL